MHSLTNTRNLLALRNKPPILLGLNNAQATDEKTQSPYLNGSKVHTTVGFEEVYFAFCRVML